MSRISLIQIIFLRQKFSFYFYLLQTIFYPSHTTNLSIIDSMKPSAKKIAPIQQSKSSTNPNKTKKLNTEQTEQITFRQSSDKKNQRFSRNRNNKTFGSDYKSKQPVQQQSPENNEKPIKNKPQEIINLRKNNVSNQQCKVEGAEVQPIQNIKQVQYQKVCKIYEQKIQELQKFVQKLQQQKYERQKYLVKSIRNSQNVLKVSNLQGNGENSYSTAKFDMNQYMQRNTKQRQQAKEILEKALKLKQKQKIQRNLLRKMKEKNNMLRSQQIQPNQKNQFQKTVDRDISSSAIIFKEQQPLQQINCGNIIKSRLQTQSQQLQPLTHQINPSKNIGLPQILYEAESIDGDQSRIFSRQKQLISQLDNLNQQLNKLQKQLSQEKSLRQNYERHIFDVDSKNADNLEEDNRRIADLQEQNTRGKDVIAKLEYLLQENIKLILQKNNHIQYLEKQIKQDKIKIRELENLKFEKQASELNILPLKQQLKQKTSQIQSMKQLFEKLKDSSNQSFKLPFLSNSKQQSIHFGSQSENNLTESLKASNNLIFDKQQFQKKLKQIQQKLQKSQIQKKTLIQTYSSFQEKLMVLSQQKQKAAILQRHFSLENNQLKDKLNQNIKMSQQLQAEKIRIENEKQKIKEQTQKHLKLLLEVMGQQKKKQITKFVQKLEDELKKYEQQNKVLQNKINQYQQQNNTYTLLNRQLQSQVKSHIDLSYHLQQTINKQQIQIQRFEESADKIKDQKDALQTKILQMKAEKQEQIEQIRKLKQQIESLNEYISGMNSEMVRSRFKEKEKQLQMQSQLDDQSQREQKLKKNKQVIEKFQQTAKNNLQLIKHHQQRIKQLEQNQLHLDIQIRGLKNKIEKKDKQIEDLQKNLLSDQYVTQEKILELQTQIIQAKNNLDALIKEREQLHEKLMQQQQIQTFNFKTIQQQKLLIEKLNDSLKSQQKQISLLKLEHLQSQQNNLDVETQINLLSKINNENNDKINEKQVLIKNLSQQIGKFKKIIVQKQQNIASKDSKIKELQMDIQQKNQKINQLEHYKELAVDYQLQFDIQSSRNKKIAESLAAKQLQYNELNQLIQQNQNKINQLTKIKDQQIKKIQQLQKLLENSNQAFIEGILNQGDISSQDLKQQIFQCCEGKVNQSNQKLFEVCKTFVIKLVQGNLIKDNKKYFQEILNFCSNLSTYSEARQNKLQNYISTMANVSGKSHQQQGNSSPDLVSSPVPIMNQKSSTLNKAKSMYLNIEQLAVKQQQPQKDRKSVILSDDFNDAFSHEGDDDDRIANYPKLDSINQFKKSRGSRQGSRGNSKQKELSVSRASGFSKSVHSVMEELQAQQEYKKDMRNLKMKAKQHRRKV